MSDWRQRLASAGAQDERLERELRYRFVAPLVRDAAVWCDLGGDPAAAAAALGEERPARIVLAGTSEDEAAELGPGTEALEADLGSPEDLRAVHGALLAGDAEGDRVATCLVALETLERFAPLVELLVELAEQHEVTAVLAVPDASAAAEPPAGPPVWGEAAVEELRRLLPEGHVLFRQVPLAGSAVAAVEGGPQRRDIPVDVDPGQAPTHVLAAFGPRAGRLTGVASAAPADVAARRAWQRGLEADAALVRTLLADRA